MAGLHSNEADEVSLPTWHWLAGRWRPEEVKPGSLFSPVRRPSSLHPASSLRPTNGASAWLCLLQPQTPAKLAGLAAFARSSGFPFGFVWSWHGSHPPHLLPPPTPSVGVAGVQAGSSPEQRESAGSVEGTELGMNHSRLVSAARGEMPSLPGCLSNKLAITGLGLRVNSTVLLFFHPRLLMRGGAIQRRLAVLGQSPPVGVSQPDERHK